MHKFVMPISCINYSTRIYSSEKFNKIDFEVKKPTTIIRINKNTETKEIHETLKFTNLTLKISKFQCSCQKFWKKWNSKIHVPLIKNPYHLSIYSPFPKFLPFQLCRYHLKSTPNRPSRSLLGPNSPTPWLSASVPSSCPEKIRDASKFSIIQWFLYYVRWKLLDL